MKYSWSRFSLGEFAWKIESFEFPCLEKKCTVTGIPSGACIHFANFVKKPRKKLDGMKQEKKTFTPCIDHFFPPSPLHKKVWRISAFTWSWTLESRWSRTGSVSFCLLFVNVVNCLCSLIDAVTSWTCCLACWLTSSAGFVVSGALSGIGCTCSKRSRWCFSTGTRRLKNYLTVLLPGLKPFCSSASCGGFGLL